MSERFVTGKLVPTVGKAAIVGGALGLASVAGVTWNNHREKTHKSLELHPVLRTILDLDQKTLGQSTYDWAAVHRIHHQFPDMSVKSFFDIYRAVKWLEGNPEKAPQVSIPRSFKHLDPFVESFSYDKVMEIGKLVDEEMRTRLGDRYEEPEGYSENRLNILFNPTSPTYTYPNFRKLFEEQGYNFDVVTQILLTDPHSPALQAAMNGHLNGVKTELIRNVPDYQLAGNMFKKLPHMKPKDLQTEDDVSDRKYTKEVVGGFIIASAVSLAMRKKISIEDAILAVAAGSATNGVKMLTEIVGGNLTNGLGHAGVMEKVSQMLNGALAKDYKITLNEDGSISTDLVKIGALGKAISALFLDEVGGQDVHHRFPWKIAYTLKTGLKGIAEAPWGSFSQWLANSKWCPLVKPGQGFDLKPGERRPDEAHQAALLIQQARVEQMQFAIAG